MKQSSGLPSVLLFDLWKTLIFSIDKDPILDVQEFLGHNLQDGHDGQRSQVRPDPRFMEVCLTTNIAEPDRFLDHVAARFGHKVSEQAHESFRRLLALEAGGVGSYPETEQVLRTLKEQGYRLGLISNLWPFPVDHIFRVRKLGDYFEHLVFSFEVGVRKPDAAIFQAACKRFAVQPGDCLMVGDNPEADVRGALVVGMQAAFIDRPGTSRLNIPGARVISSLSDLVVAQS